METYHGHVRTPADAIILFEACRKGLLPRVQRRLSEKERQQIKSGSVFVWDEREAGMRRWTDGKSWSASRVAGSFLTYREMEGKRGGSYPAPSPAAKRTVNGVSPDGTPAGDSEGEGPDGYRYKPDGLMKQSFSITTQSGQHLHLISYFSRSHSATLPQPTSDPSLRHIRPPPKMYPESVNDNQSVPAVTRGPMEGAPYAHVASPQQMPPQPQPQYSRPGPAHQMPVLYSPYPGPPTPPYHQQTYFVSHMNPNQMYQHGPVYYTQPGYPPPPGPQERPPPHVSHMQNQYPQATYPAHPAYQGYPGHPHPDYRVQMGPQGPQGPQYYPAHPPRPLQATDPAQQQSQPSAHPTSHHQISQSAASMPEQGPVLPALNGVGKSTTPQPSEPKTNDSSNPTDTNGTSQNNAPSPPRTIPNIHTLLNANVADHGADSMGNKSHSRSGSPAPGNNTQRPPREMIAPMNNATMSTRATDNRAISMLNSSFV